MTSWHTRHRKSRESREASMRAEAPVPSAASSWRGPVWAARAGKADKGAWRMPRLTEAMKDVTSCEKPRGGASDL